MKQFVKSAVLGLFLILTVQLTYSQVNNYGKLSFNKAVNISGKQRMLTQRMGKIYLYLLNNPNDFKAQKDLKISSIIFEKQNLILKNNTKSGLTRNKIQEVESTWEKYKKFIGGSPNNKDAVKVINTNSTILKQANNVVEAIILESKKSVGSDNYIAEEESELKTIINKAGRQRMLAQRLALYYFANKPDLKTGKSIVKLDKVYTEIDSALSDLLISSFNNDRVDEAIGEVMGLWEDVKSNKERLFKQGYKDAEVYKLSNDLTKLFNKVTNLYEKTKIE